MRMLISLDHKLKLCWRKQDSKLWYQEMVNLYRIAKLIGNCMSCYYYHYHYFFITIIGICMDYYYYYIIVAIIIYLFFKGWKLYGLIGNWKIVRKHHINPYKSWGMFEVSWIFINGFGLKRFLQLADYSCCSKMGEKKK